VPDTEADQIQTDSPDRIVRRLMRSCDRAVLSTNERAGKRPAEEKPADNGADNGAETPQAAGSGWPYGSLVLMASAPDASPILLISTLAEHTRNLLADPRACLLLDGTAGLEDPLTGARASVMGRLTRLDPEAAEARMLRDRYVRRHPGAESYIGFGDFALWRMSVERAHLVAGFGRIHWIDGPPCLGEAGLPLETREADVVDHMNADHADAVALYATKLLGLDPGPWQLTGVDAEGADLRLGGAVARLDFVKPVTDAEEARVELVRLVKRARTL
jgi:hypothetical protein